MILVCGGAGYIGSHMVRHLMTRGHDVVVFDNLSTGHPEAVGDALLIKGDLLDQGALDAVFDTHAIGAVMHFCAYSLVGESVANPYAYYQNNVTGTLSLLQAMRRAGIDKLVFSSSAAVFEPTDEPIGEDHPTQPLNPYGASKLMVERILADAAVAYGLRSASLRYFNAAGASPSGDIGESHHPETHLIPNALRAALNGETLRIFGDDYSTRDGTCIRDYVHVDDLASAHLKALAFLMQNKGAHRFNLGSEQGFSVLEIIHSIERVAGLGISVERAPRRPGDPPILVADSRYAKEQLGWTSTFTNIDEIICTAWRWHGHARY